MKAMILNQISHFDKNLNPLRLVEIPIPEPKENEILIKVKACGVCHTDLDEIEGRTVPSFYPVIPGHQVVGIVAEKGGGVTKHKIDDRVGVGWIFSSCGECNFCLEGRENLCSYFKAQDRMQTADMPNIWLFLKILPLKSLPFLRMKKLHLCFAEAL